MEVKMKNIKTQKKVKVQGIKSQKQIMTLYDVRQQIKDLKQIEKQIVDELKVLQNECPIAFEQTFMVPNKSAQTFKYVLDISNQTRNVFNQSEFKEQNTDLFYKFVNKQLVTIVKVDRR